MRSIERFGRLVTHTVQIEAATGKDGYGKPTYAAPVTYRCDVSGQRKLVRNALGQEVVSSQSIILICHDPILPTARVTLSTDDVGSTEDHAIHPPILALERYTDQFDWHHVTLRLA